MTAFSRRSVLAGIGAATTAGAVAAVSTAAAAPPTGENEALLDAWAAFNAALAEYDAAYERKEFAKAAFNSLHPHMPPEIRCLSSQVLGDGSRAHGYVAERFRDADGKDIHDSRRGYVWVADSYQIGRSLAYLDGRSSIAKRLKQIRTLAIEFETGLAQARKVSGLDEALEPLWRADNKLRRAVEDIAIAPAHTMHGLAIKSASLVAAISRDSEYAWTYAANGQRLAEQVHAILGGLLS